MSNRFLPGMPAIPIDVDAKLEINGWSPVDVGVWAWEKAAHAFYDTPRAFARDFANAIGEKRDLTAAEVQELRRSIARAIDPDFDQSDNYFDYIEDSESVESAD